MSSLGFRYFIPAIAFLALFSFRGHSQTLKYSIYKGSSEIGEIVVSRTQNNHVCDYHVTSLASFRVILKYERKTSMKTSYYDNVLESAHSKTHLNGKLEESNVTRRTVEAYLGQTLDGDTLKLSYPITFSSAMLYFKEPVGVKEIYAESYLAMCPIEPVGNHTYKLTLPGDKINFYTYKNRVLTEVLVQRSWFDINFRLKD